MYELIAEKMKRSSLKSKTINGKMERNSRQSSKTEMINLKIKKRRQTGSKESKSGVKLELPRSKLKIDKKELDCLINTGASHSFAIKKSVRELN